MNFFKPNLKKIILFIVVCGLSYVFYKYAINQSFFCFLQEQCSRPFLDKLLQITALIFFVIPLYSGWLLAAITGTAENSKAFVYIVASGGIICLYLLTCVFYSVYFAFKNKYNITQQYQHKLFK